VERIPPLLLLFHTLRNMRRLESNRSPMPIRCALLTVSTHTEPVSDEAADAVRGHLKSAVPQILFVEERRTASDRHLIEEILRRWCDEEDMDLVLTIGGAFPAPGHSGEQITPEATMAVLDRTMPSLPETMRAYAVEETPDALLDRGVAGIRARTLIVNLPGPERLAQMFVEAISDLIEPIVARLQPEPTQPITRSAVMDEPAAGAADQSQSPGLDADEFASFLAARQRR